MPIPAALRSAASAPPMPTERLSHAIISTGAATGKSRLCRANRIRCCLRNGFHLRLLRGTARHPAGQDRLHDRQRRICTIQGISRHEAVSGGARRHRRFHGGLCSDRGSRSRNHEPRCANSATSCRATTASSLHSTELIGKFYSPGSTAVCVDLGAGGRGGVLRACLDSGPAGRRFQTEVPMKLVERDSVRKLTPNERI